MPQFPNPSSLVVNHLQYIRGISKIKIAIDQKFPCCNFKILLFVLVPVSREAYLLPSSYQPFHVSENSFTQPILYSRD